MKVGTECWYNFVENYDNVVDELGQWHDMSWENIVDEVWDNVVDQIWDNFVYEIWDNFVDQIWDNVVHEIWDNANEIQENV